LVAHAGGPPVLLHLPSGLSVWAQLRAPEDTGRA
jgi:hypothetical protein